jgi:polyferredoxin
MRSLGALFARNKAATRRHLTKRHRARARIDQRYRRTFFWLLVGFALVCVLLYQISIYVWNHIEDDDKDKPTLVVKPS